MASWLKASLREIGLEAGLAYEREHYPDNAPDHETRVAQFKKQ
jgi:hypothetical protein